MLYLVFNISLLNFTGGVLTEGAKSYPKLVVILEGAEDGLEPNPDFYSFYRISCAKASLPRRSPM